MNKVKRSGPRWLPCGTLDVTRRIQDIIIIKESFYIWNCDIYIPYMGTVKIPK